VVVVVVVEVLVDVDVEINAVELDVDVFVGAARFDNSVSVVRFVDAKVLLLITVEVEGSV